MPIVSIEQAIQIAIDHHKQGRCAEAEAIYRQILAQQPNHPGALHLLGVLTGDAGNLPAAEDLIRRAMAVCPQEPMYPANLGRLLARHGRPAEAVALFRESLRWAPTDADIWFDLGVSLQNLQHWPDAERAYRESIRLNPHHASSWANLAGVLRMMQRLDESLDCSHRALQIQPNAVEAMANAGATLESKGDMEGALAWYQRALATGAKNPGLYYNMGVALAALGRYQEAEAAYRAVLTQNPRHAHAHNNLGGLYRSAAKPDLALHHFQQALSLVPNFPQALANLGEVLLNIGRRKEGVAAYRQASQLAPDYPEFQSGVLFSLLFDPHSFAADLQAAHADWNQRHAVPLEGLIKPHTRSSGCENRKLRIGYVSADFSDHVVARNLLPLFRDHDRSQFEIFCYSNDRLRDDITERIAGLSNSFRQVEMLSDDAFADLLRADRIDILVDLSLHMFGNRLLTFARKPAPIQATFAGYPGSTGVNAIDYRLTDRHLDPVGEDHWYSEKSVRLESFWCYQPLEQVAVSDLPADHVGQITFGCFNNFCKVNEPVLSLWAEVLRAIPTSNLVILCTEGSHRQQVSNLLASQDVSAERLRFLAPRPRVDYLRAFHEIDISLDTFPYNGHTTSLDSLWMGVPVITLVGDRVVGRAGLSQLLNAGLPELIARSPAEYVALAAGLAGDIDRLRALRRALRGRLESSVLMDARRFASTIESAYRDMWRVYVSR